MAPARVEAVIFDMDGVLVDSEPFWRRVEAGLFDEVGVDVRPLLERKVTMGMRVDEAVETLATLSGAGRIDSERFADRIVAGVVDAISSCGELLPGALEALELCVAAGLKVALASGSTTPVIDAVLDRFDLRRRFAAVCSAEDDPMGKPHPSIFLRAAEILGVSPATCVVVEDSLNGCIAAKAARMQVIAVPHVDDAHDPRFAIADLTLASLVDLRGPRVAELLGTAVAGSSGSPAGLAASASSGGHPE